MQYKVTYTKGSGKTVYSVPVFEAADMDEFYEKIKDIFWGIAMRKHGMATCELTTDKSGKLQVNVHPALIFDKPYALHLSVREA